MKTERCYVCKLEKKAHGVYCQGCLDREVGTMADPGQEMLDAYETWQEHHDPLAVAKREATLSGRRGALLQAADIAIKYSDPKYSNLCPNKLARILSDAYRRLAR